MEEAGGEEGSSLQVGGQGGHYTHTTSDPIWKNLWFFLNTLTVLLLCHTMGSCHSCLWEGRMESALQGHACYAHDSLVILLLPSLPHSYPSSFWTVLILVGCIQFYTGHWTGRRSCDSHAAFYTQIICHTLVYVCALPYLEGRGFSLYVFGF